jgi:hypothetical protein
VRILKFPHQLTRENLGTPRVLFVALDPKSQRFIVGASSLNFPRKFRKNIYTIYSEKRKEALEAIPGNRKLRKALRRLSALAKSDADMNNCTLLFLGHLAEAFSVPGFATKMPCGKCSRIYGFVTSATGQGCRHLRERVYQMR